MILELFNVGARWRHQNLGFVVHITEEIEPGRYLLGFAPEHQPVVVTGPGGVQSEPFRAPDFMSSYILKGVFTAQDLIRDFESLELTLDRWDQILENLDEDD